MSRSFVKLERLVCDLERFAFMPAGDISVGDALDMLADLSKTLPAARGEAQNLFGLNDHAQKGKKSGG